MKHRKNITIISFLIVSFTLIANATASKIAYEAKGRRDPFIPLQNKGVRTISAASTFAVEGIIYDPPLNSLAVIGGETYRVGDKVDQAKIVEIRKDHVIIEERVTGEDGEEIQRKTLWIRGEEEF